MAVGSNINNPGDLLAGTSWTGQVSPYTSPNGLTYAAFSTPQAGINALQTDLTTAINNGANTLSSLVYHYLGTSTNNAANPAVSNYLSNVSQATGIAPNQAITSADVPNLAYGISVAEGTASAFPQMSPAASQAGAASGVYQPGTLGSILEGIGVPSTFLTGAAGVAAEVTGQPQQVGGGLSVTPAQANTAIGQTTGIDFSGITNALNTFNATLSAAFSASTWTRVAVVGLAIVLLIGALIILAKGPILETASVTGAT